MRAALLRLRIAVATGLSAAPGCKDRDASVRPLPGLEGVELAAAAHGQTPNITVGHHGRIALTWQQAQGEATAVRYSTRNADGSFAAPATVTHGQNLFVNYADFPTMMAVGERGLVATWLARHEGGYGIRLATRSTPETPKFAAAPLTPNVTGPEFGFVSMTPLPDDKLAMFWLDGRASGGHEGGGAMQLRGAEVDADGTVARRRLIDDRVCDCCQTAAATTELGPVVVYRDRSEAEVRDIAVAGPAETQRRVVARDGWSIAGCPVNGPAIAASASGLAVAWFTGADNVSAVKVAFADIDGAFAAPIRVDLGKPTGRVDVEWLSADLALVSFVEVGDLLARTVDRRGRVGPPWRVAAVAPSNATGFPRLVRAADTLVWTWTDALSEPPRVRLAQTSTAQVLPP